MLVIKIQGKDSALSWTNWGGHEKKQLAGRLQSACPSLRLTERKRLARLIVDGAAISIPVEVPKYAESLYHILESTGTVASMREEEAIFEGSAAPERAAGPGLNKPNE